MKIGDYTTDKRREKIHIANVKYVTYAKRNLKITMIQIVKKFQSAVSTLVNIELQHIAYKF